MGFGVVVLVLLVAGLLVGRRRARSGGGHPGEHSGHWAPGHHPGGGISTGGDGGGACS